jgi:hypothetical protein
MNVEFGNEAARSFISGNICFEFSVQCICSIELLVYRYYCVCPLVQIGTPLPPLPLASVTPFPSRNQRGGHTHLWAKGWGGPNSDDWRTLSTLCMEKSRKSYSFFKGNAEDLTLDMQGEKTGSALEAVKEPLLEADDEVVGYVQDLQVR